MKFAATLIATVAAIKMDDLPSDVGLPLPVLSDAAAALANTEVADASTIAAVADLTPGEAIDLVVYCNIENTCAKNFDALIEELCMVEVPAAGCDAIQAMFEGLEDRIGETGSMSGPEEADAGQDPEELSPEDVMARFGEGLVNIFESAGEEPAGSAAEEPAGSAAEEPAGSGAEEPEE